MRLRRDGAAVCHLLLSHQACIWPCALFKRRWISKQPFCFYYRSKGQFTGELRRIVPPKPVCKDLQLVKSQILLQSWTSVGSHAVGCSLQWAEFILFIGFCLEMSASLSSLNISLNALDPAVSLSHMHAFCSSAISRTAFPRKGDVHVKSLKESASCHLSLPRISFLV